jgi:hypothetical protein
MMPHNAAANAQLRPIEQFRMVHLTMLFLRQGLRWWRRSPREFPAAAVQKPSGGRGNDEVNIGRSEKVV